MIQMSFQDDQTGTAVGKNKTGGEAPMAWKRGHRVGSEKIRA